MEERVITVPLRDAKDAPRQERANRAMRVVREHLAQHFKADEAAVNLDGSINESVWAQGRSSIPSTVRVRAAKFDDGVVEAELAE